MINYFTLNNYRKHFSVVIIDNNVTVFRIENRDKIWEGLVKNIFIGKSCLNEMTINSGARDNSLLDGNTILLEIEDRRYIFIGNSVYSFETKDKIIKFISNVEIILYLMLLLMEKRIFIIWVIWFIYLIFQYKIMG